MPEATFKEVAGLNWREWPTLAIPSESALRALALRSGIEAVREGHRLYHETIEREESDPLNFGWDSPCTTTLRELLAGTYVPGKIGSALIPDWKMAKPANDVLELGGNGSGKTRSAARLVMELLVSKSAREVRCYSQNEMTSRRYQQPALFAHLPPALRKMKKVGQTVKISYTEATGFSENLFILPNRSSCLLLTYKGWSQDRTSAEGGEADCVWCDEETPVDLAATLRFRVHKKGGTFLLTYTPISGYGGATPDYLEGATILETIPARRANWDPIQRKIVWGEPILPQDVELVPGCPKGHIPYVLKSAADNRYCILFPTTFNPYTNVEAIVTGASEKSREFILERVFGWPTKRAARAFPRFGDIHIVKHDRIPKEGTNYFFTDPHGSRNWFMVWFRVTRDGRIFVYREWPSAKEGEWALPGEKPDGKEGPAQRFCAGMSFNDYKRLILKQEGWWEKDRAMVRPPKERATVDEIFERRMDPRPAATEVPSDEQALTVVDHMNTPAKSGDQILIPGLAFSAAPACGIEEGIGLINDWLTNGWDPDQETTPFNCPSFYVSENCPNLIYSLKTWTGLDGEKGATKDPVDCLRNAAKMGLESGENLRTWR